MKKFGAIMGLAALFLVLALSLAEAARLGGGRSFGSKSTYSRSYSKPVSPTSSPSQAPSQMAQPRTGVTPPLGAAQPGMFSRMGWGLGGLMAGGLIGSMLFGRGMGMGAGGIGFLDILLIGAIIFFAVKLLRRRNTAPQDNAFARQDGSQSFAAPGQTPTDDARVRAGQSWDALRSQPGAGGMGGFGAATAQPQVRPEAEVQPTVPPGFSVPDFLEGAKTVYARLQHSWDRRDLNDIALFTTPEVLEEIRRQAGVDPKPSKTELMLINARLLEFREDPRDTVVTVYFDVLLREDVTEDRPKQIREVWHFSRPTGDADANWRLEGIQQLEA
ncbi:MAG: TIM44-like domain-containing protein [Humidesulfovibrio sp.]|nr:TIM44-like domain-containing protein [Humidesulfovibrio sp.]